MGIFDFLTGKSQQQREGTFRLADGSSLSPEQFGYLAVGVGHQNSASEIQEVFGDSVLIREQELSRAVIQNPVDSALILTALEASAYVYWAVIKLRVDQEVALRVFKGMYDHFLILRNRSGQNLTNTKASNLVKLSRELAIAIANDVQENSTRDPEVFVSKPPTSTSLFLSSLMSELTDDPSRIESWNSSMSTPARLFLHSTLEASMLGTLQTLKEKLKVTFV